jgi:hypothetical protein
METAPQDGNLKSRPEAPTTDLSTVWTWDEAAEIAFVEEEEINPNCHHCSSAGHFHVPSRQELKARHMPGPLYFPVLILTW